MAKSNNRVAAEVTTERPKHGGKFELESLDIQPAKNGGFIMRKRMRPIATSSSTPMGWMEPEVYTYASFDELVKGMKKCLA